MKVFLLRTCSVRDQSIPSRSERASAAPCACEAGVRPLVMDGGAPVSGGDGDGWIQYRIFLANPTETTPRGKELEALSWIPTLDRYDYILSLSIDALTLM